MIELKNVIIHKGILYIEYLKLALGSYYIKGESGSGKTSLLKCLSREVSCEGEVNISGSVRSYYQDEILNYNCSLYDMSRIDLSINRKVYYELLLLLDMVESERKKSTKLSRGEKQRAELILTLSCDSDIYLLDEPCSSLNYKYRKSVYSWINKQPNKLFVVTTHDNVKDYLSIVNGNMEKYIDERNVNEEYHYKYNKCNYKVLFKLWFNIPKTIINILNVSLTLCCLYISFNIDKFFDDSIVAKYSLIKMKTPINNLKVLCVIFSILSIVMYVIYYILDMHSNKRSIQNFKNRYSTQTINKYLFIRLLIEFIIILISFLIIVILIKVKY